ncbi:hypothetical protein [Bacillus pakistanensis]|uniref:hypothetical protein n=1 Tax=Rossellomorea pakistanensis TaxID=992288 RepID=UPI001962C487|nr:hypothetical protein [Bacillus pakistanensis]
MLVSKTIEDVVFYYFIIAEKGYLNSLALETSFHCFIKNTAIIKNGGVNDGSAVDLKKPLSKVRKWYLN